MTVVSKEVSALDKLTGKGLVWRVVRVPDYLGLKGVGRIESEVCVSESEGFLRSKLIAN